MSKPIADRIKIAGAGDVYFALIERNKGNIQRENVGGIISIIDGPLERDPGFTEPRRYRKFPHRFLRIADSHHHLPVIPENLRHKYSPTVQNIRDAFEFAGRIDEDKDLVVHCHIGRFRAPTISRALIAREYGPGREREAVQKLLSIKGNAGASFPMVKIADDLLGRDGALLAAVMSEPKIAMQLVKIEQSWRQDMIEGQKPIPPAVFIVDPADRLPRPNPEVCRPYCRTDFGVSGIVS